MPYASLTAVIASNLPDFEIVTGFAGTPTYIEYHRGITHTFVGIPILSLALALAIYIFSGNFWRTFLTALVAMATHPLLDYLNTYGVRPFVPFNDTWYYGDLLFVIDPYLDLILLIGVVAGFRFRDRRRLFAAASMVLALAYIGMRGEFRNQARERLEAYKSSIPNAVKAAVLPRMLNPRILDGIVETRDEVIKVRIDALDGVQRELARMPKSPPSEIIGHAAIARSAAVFLEFARFPVIRVEPTEFGERVVFVDFRFYDERTNSAFAAEVVLDHSLDVVEDSLGFGQPVN